ncbi:Aminopeptidase N, partial [Armadillidium vulgare]
QYDNAVQGDLWRFLTQSWNESESFDPSRTVQTIMNTWTLQEGYPVVNITRNTTHLFLSQERFLLRVKSNNSSENTDSQEWWIPIKENKWFIINVQKTGFYRVNYDDSNWLRLKEQLLNNFSLIHRLNREQIIDDAFNLARIGYVEYDLPLGISDYIKMEKDLTVWTTFLNNFKYILDMARNHKNDTIEFFDVNFLQFDNN